MDNKTKISASWQENKLKKLDHPFRGAEAG
jgi:hypothetical protein